MHARMHALSTTRLVPSSRHWTHVSQPLALSRAAGGVPVEGPDPLLWRGSSTISKCSLALLPCTCCSTSIPKMRPLGWSPAGSWHLRQVELEVFAQLVLAVVAPVAAGAGEAQLAHVHLPVGAQLPLGSPCRSGRRRRGTRPSARAGGWPGGRRWQSPCRSGSSGGGTAPPACTSGSAARPAW